ncbi:hypothetical protein A2Y83_03250 [Candidatus Falkowbacteria bacterium RBG_13_39_14]|uniref:Mur ligase central domain-containing protein n=1 Tax=Candidatus Falkowbacteria bacterium RBG_13_39_14 TaxID=1797985 RepID=A0A1F5S618_9BACT|nr:MAG: hypothetical protein A2Y83_03250 [Candidatus Falkowbacteria bacterium RBG_13_39_14]
MEYILNKIKKLIPKSLLEFIRPAYHKTLARAAAFWYGYPAEKMIVIGVTGTNGKSTSTELIAKVLGYAKQPQSSADNGAQRECDPSHEGGARSELTRMNKAGFASTVKFKVGDKEWLNDKKMTMLGRFALQKLLRDMANAGCKYAVIETSSEGIKQSRHIGINYDYLVFTNLTPEHIESHGSFEKYKEAKLSLFKHLADSKRKSIKKVFGGRTEKKLEIRNWKLEIQKIIIVNGDDKYADEFLNFDVDEKAVYGVDAGKDNNSRDGAFRLSKKVVLSSRPSDGGASGGISFAKISLSRAKGISLDKLGTGSRLRFAPLGMTLFRQPALPCLYRAENVKMDKTGVEFELDGVKFKLNMPGRFNVYNAMPAIIIGHLEGMGMEEIKEALGKIEGVPGRMEFIDEGQDFSVLIDYAPEPESMKKLYEAVAEMRCEVVESVSTAGTPTPSDSPRQIGGQALGRGRACKIIHVLGSCGGGRDKARRRVLGKMAAENADVVIVTNEDPYDDDPMEIIEEVAKGAISTKQKSNKTTKQDGAESKMRLQDSTAHGKIPPTPPLDRLRAGSSEKGGIQKVFKILDRREAIRKALELAEKGDLVLITGKGAEQAMCVAGGKKIAWDDREVVRLELRSKK